MPVPPINAYTPPAAVDSSVVSEQLPYFEVGLGKFVTLSILTFGIYDLYWMYQQWKRIKARTSEDLSPFWRAFFSAFWCYSLLQRIRSDTIADRLAVDWTSGYLATMYFILVCLWRLPDPWWLVCYLSFLPLVPVVQTIATLHDGHAAVRDKNTHFSGANVATVIIGCIVLLLILVGVFLPAPPADVPTAIGA